MPALPPSSRALSALALAAGLTLAGAMPRPALATELLAAWAGAEQHDPELAVARAARAGARPLLEQAAALWRPGVQLVASAGAASHDSDTRGAHFAAPGMGENDGVDFSTSVHGGTATRWALQASQPLYHPQRRVQQQLLQLQADRAELQWQAAHQQAMLRTAERYLDAALAQQALQLTRQQLQAVQRALEEAQERFRIGDAPITDTHEAGARLAALQAQELAAQVALQVKLRLLADTTGLPPETLRPQLPAAAPTATAASAATALPLAHWQQQAEDANPGIRLRRLAQELARAEADKHSARAAPSVELVAQAGQERLHGSGDFGRARNSARSASVGVQLTVPLYTGGMREARQEQALRQLGQAQAQVDSTRQQVASQTHAAWLGLSAGAQRVQALDQALKASQSRLDATRTGREAGDRTLLDWLNAQNDAAATELALSQARGDLLLGGLRLALLAGQLDEQRLRMASQALAASSTAEAAADAATGSAQKKTSEKQ